MKEFDENSYCPKCGCTDISANWLEHDKSRWHHIGDVDREQREHIRRRCTRCNYRWNEAPLDARAAMGESDE